MRDLHADYQLTTAPACEPLDLDTVKTHLKVDGTDEDIYIQGLISGARMYAENFLRLSLITQQWSLLLDAFPGEFNPFFNGFAFYGYGLSISRRDHNAIMLAHGPIQGVPAITYYDVNGAEQTLTQWNGTNGTTGFQLGANNNRPRLKPAPLTEWPVTNLDQIGAVEIAFTAGFGDDGDAVPQPIKNAMLLHIGTSYQNREGSIVGAQVSPLPQNSSVDDLYWQYRAYTFS